MDTDAETEGGSGPASSTAATAPGSSSGATETGTAQTESGTMGCQDGFVYEEPGCQEVSFAAIPLPEAGCYEPCEVQGEPCVVGTCARTITDPCHCGEGGGCCDDLCGEEQLYCLTVAPLAPDFEDQLVAQGGCGFSSASLWAASEDGSIGLALNLVGPFDMGDGGTYQVTLPADEASVSVVLGPQIASDFCNDAPLGTLIDRYLATSGTILVSWEPGGDSESHVATVSATLTDVVVSRDGLGDPVTIEDFTFDAIEVWCCPG